MLLVFLAIVLPIIPPHTVNTPSKMECPCLCPGPAPLAHSLSVLTVLEASEGGCPEAMTCFIMQHFFLIFEEK